jgi:hypothetical protein
MHGAVDPDSVPETPSERWQAEGLYLEFLATSQRGLPALSAWLEQHPNGGRELARSVPSPVDDRPT